ncbi:hypothetical protein B0I35DRAFT_320808, partial [Stachybotrys elegans]
MMMLIKASILLEWVRMFCPTKSGLLWWGCMILLAFDLPFHPSAIIAFNLQCNPHAKMWNRLLPGTCVSDASARSLDIISSVSSVFIDLTILVLPQKVIWGLKLNFRKKLGVASMFAVGVLGITSATFRLETTIRYLSTHDVTYIFSEVVLW